MFPLANIVMWIGGSVAVAAVGGAIAYGVIAAREPPAAAPPAPAIAAPPSPPPQNAASAPPAVAPAAVPAAPAPKPPEFDVVRVEPSGETVVAARGEPKVKIALLDGAAAIAETVSDAQGQVVFLPPPLAPGEHALSLRMEGPAGPILSTGAVTVSVAPKAKEAPLVALATPDAPIKVLSDPLAKPAPSATPAEPAAVSVRTVEIDEKGAFFATGAAAPGASVRLYLNGSYVAGVIADAAGKWSLTVSRGMQPGAYAVRADEVEAATGKVVSRAEVPFDYPAAAAPVAPPAPVVPPAVAAAPVAPSPAAAQPSQASAPLAAAPAPAAAPAEATPAHAVVPQLQSATVLRGDSLWRISRRVLGRGIRYTQIYEANTAQIRNPRLIYPGQVFVVPNGEPR